MRSRPFPPVLVAVAAVIAAGSARAADAPLRLRCDGEARRAEAQTTRSYSSRNGAETQTTLRDKVRSDLVKFEMADGRARVFLPDSLIPPLNDPEEDGWWKVTDLKVADGEITGRFRINFANKPTFRIDRLHGDIDLQGYQLSFRGQCEPDTVTERKF